MKTLKEEIQHIDLKLIVPDENQPRKYFDPVKINHLKTSVEKYGIMNPITVEKVGEKYLLVDGERRFRAASELKLKEVPALVIAPQSAVDRLIQQFHIQEQHEGWTALEKASVVGELSKEMDIPIQELANMLGIERRQASQYSAFHSLLERKEMVKHEIGINWAGPINTICNLATRLYTDVLKEPFDQTMRRKLEKAILTQIKTGELQKTVHLNKLKDVFTKSPKEISSFVEKGVSVSELFLKTKAQGAYHLRQASTSASYVVNHTKKYLETADAIPTPIQVQNFKAAKASLEALLKKIED